MRSWNLQQMAEKQASDWETKEDEERYANYVKMLTERRQMLEQEESDERKQNRLDVARDNMNLSVQKEQNRKVFY
jgi:GH18 family chitinase